MTLDEAIYQYANQTKKEREKGRYWASEIYKIKKGYLKPKDFYNKREPVEGYSLGNICQGIAGENFIGMVLNEVGVKHTPQASCEIEILPGITISGKADFRFDKGIFEVKAPTKPLEEIPERYKDQLEAYWQAFRLPVYLCEVKFYPFSVNVWPYEPDQGRWEETKEKIIEFHSKVCPNQSEKK